MFVEETKGWSLGLHEVKGLLAVRVADWRGAVEELTPRFVTGLMGASSLWLVVLFMRDFVKRKRSEEESQASE